MADVWGRLQATYFVNQRDINYLYDVYLGKQDILQKVKANRPEINHKVVVNHAYEVVSFVAGHVYSDPIQYVRKGM